MPWMGRPSFLPLPPETRINKGFADPFLQVFSRIFWKRLFWRWFLACSQFVHIYRRNEGNFSLSAAPIITDFFRFHKQIISHYCDHYLRSHHPPAVSFRAGVHDPGSSPRTTRQHILHFISPLHSPIPTAIIEKMKIIPRRYL